jgi:Flp pilus assembly protein TadG
MEWETLSSRLKDKKGTVTVTVAVLLLFLIMFAAFAIDVGYMMVRRNELQNIADTAALAATGELGSVYETKPYQEALTYTPAPGPFLAKAQEVASATGVSGVTITPPSTDFQLGVWNPSTHTFYPQATRPTAVNVIARKDSVANGPFSTLLAGVLGIGNFNVSAIATASLTPPLRVFEGELPLPVGISLAWFDPARWEGASLCDQPIKLYPTGDITGCAGWHVYTQTPSSASTLRDTIDGLINGTYLSPETTAGQTQFDFTGGNVANALRNMTDLFDQKKQSDPGGPCAARYGSKYGGSSWTTCVPVYGPPDWTGIIPKQIAAIHTEP